MKRYALVSMERDSSYTIAGYLPANYKIVGELILLEEAASFWPGKYSIISGEDNAGWTLDGYVIPRLGSGLIAAREIKLEDWLP